MKLRWYLISGFCVTLWSVLIPSSCLGLSDSESASAEEESETGANAADEEVPQRDIIDLFAKLLGRRVDPKLEGESRVGVSWAILPTVSYNPVYGAAVGAAVSGAGRTGVGPHARPTFVSVSGNYSTQGQVQALVRGESSTPSGDYLLKADLRYLDTQRSTWGLGPITQNREEFPLDYVLYRAYTTVYRRTAGPVYLGFGYRYDEFSDIVDKRAESGEDTPFSEYSGQGVLRTVASGLSLNLLGDTRDNLSNPSAGYFLQGSFRTYLKELGSDENWQEFWVSSRLYPYVPPGSNRMLAFWLYGWFTFGPAPYLNLPATGWDTYGRGARGYLQDRIRAKNHIYVESEYRFSLRQDGLLGAVLFINGTASTVTESGTFGSMDPGGGVGLRIKFNKDSRTNLAIDKAWGRYYDGWWLGMSEVF